MKPLLRKKDLVQVFRKAGLGCIRHLIVHSSLSSLGRVDGGADAVIDALMEALDAQGSLLVPTFNYSLESGVFDPATVPSHDAVRPLSPHDAVRLLAPDGATVPSQGRKPLGSKL